MPVEVAVDLGTIVNGLSVAALLWLGRSLWNSAQLLTELKTQLDAHERHDDENFTAIRQDIRDLRRTG